MNWARTLMLADMLTKAIQANVAREANVAVTRPKANEKEPTMSDQDINGTNAAPAPVTLDNDSTGDATTQTVAETQVALDQDATGQTASPGAQPASSTATNVAAHIAALPQDLDRVGARLISAANLVQTLRDHPEMIEILKLLMSHPSAAETSASATANESSSETAGTPRTSTA